MGMNALADGSPEPHSVRAAAQTAAATIGSGEKSPNSEPQPVGPDVASHEPPLSPGDALDSAIEKAQKAHDKVFSPPPSTPSEGSIRDFFMDDGAQFRNFLLDTYNMHLTRNALAAAQAAAADAVAADIAAQGYSKADVEAARAAALAEAKRGSSYAAVQGAGQAATSGNASAGGGGTGVPGATTGNAATGQGGSSSSGGGGHGGVGAGRFRHGDKRRRWWPRASRQELAVFGFGLYFGYSLAGN